MLAKFNRLSLLWKILLSTSVALTLLFAITAWIVQQNATRAMSESLADETDASFHAYDSLWKSRAEMLASVSLVLSRMSDVRAAFSTGDEATIRDTAAELWNKVSTQDAIFLVTDPRGKVIASLGGTLAEALKTDLPIVRQASARFPEQSSGFMMTGQQLYHVAVTPVYVQAGSDLGLLDVLVVGYAVDQNLAQKLKDATGGSEFCFLAGGRLIASTLDDPAVALAKPLELSRGRLQRLVTSRGEYTVLERPLLDVRGSPIGQLRILRSFEGARQRISDLRRNIVIIWVFAILVGLALTNSLARRILEPVKELDRGAAEVARGNYTYRIPAPSGEKLNSEKLNKDELGRLAVAFNAMCTSIHEAREELIRHERIATIGRLATSIVHDLRNPLAAIYGGAEMLVDGNLSPVQIKRLAGNMYRSSRHIQQLLQELMDSGRGKGNGSEVCRLSDIVSAAYGVHAGTAAAQGVAAEIVIPADIELPLERARMERVFSNLIDNALAAMPRGGSLRITAESSGNAVTVRVEDSGPGIAPQIRPHLFQPFVTSGKKNGVGLGLAFSHQTVLDHGGDLWADSDTEQGARFVLRLPV
jgi:signal transduction histidine kinase